MMAKRSLLVAVALCLIALGANASIVAKSPEEDTDAEFKKEMEEVDAEDDGADSAVKVAPPPKAVSRTSLITIKKELVHPVLAEAAGLKPETAPAMDMESAVTQMVMGGSAFGATPMGGSVKKIKDLIAKTMMPAVLDAHKASQNELNRLIKHLHACSTGKNVAWKGVNTEFKKYRKNSPLHKNCRGNEAVRFTSKMACLEEEKDKKEVKRLKCTFFAQVAKRVGDENSNRQIIKRGGSESVATYVRRISATICGGNKGNKDTRRRRGGSGGGGGLLDDYDKARVSCEQASKAYNAQVRKCNLKKRQYAAKKRQCNAFQNLMDTAACKRAVLVKDACETYAECYKSKRETYSTARKAVIIEEKDRKAEWRGLKRMLCLINSFGDGKVSNAEVDRCRKQAHSTNHLIIKYPKVPRMQACSIPKAYPATARYKKLEFVPLPAMAKGREPKDCTGVREINTRPAKGSPKSCKCVRVTLNGPFSPGAMVKCHKCLDARRSKDRNSCPDGTKVFSPRSRTDWQTFIRSAGPLRNPHFIIDVTRPQNGCGGCTKHPMNIANKAQKTWRTADGSPWWLRSTRYNEPNGDYHANCYLDLWHTPKNPNAITWNDGSCGYHSKSYYCQAKAFSSKPAKGSPRSCRCKKVELAGKYSAGLLLKCEQCLQVHRSTQKNSCPSGMKIFSPRSRHDWRTFIRSAGPLRSPHWIIDITRPQNGCGGCTRHPMTSKNANQATWRTRDGSQWWLRSTKYSEPNGDYNANCFLDLWRTPANENAVTFNDGRCNYRSNSYYCQPSKKKKR